MNSLPPIGSGTPPVYPNVPPANNAPPAAASGQQQPPPSSSPAAPAALPNPDGTSYTDIVSEADMKCPISQDYMTNPRMLLPCSHHVDSTSWEQQQRMSAIAQRNLCPVCKQKVINIANNILLKNIIASYKQKHNIVDDPEPTPVPPASLQASARPAAAPPSERLPDAVLEQLGVVWAYLQTNNVNNAIDVLLDLQSRFPAIQTIQSLLTRILSGETVQARDLYVTPPALVSGGVSISSPPPSLLQNSSSPAPAQPSRRRPYEMTINPLEPPAPPPSRARRTPNVTSPSPAHQMHPSQPAPSLLQNARAIMFVTQPSQSQPRPPMAAPPTPMEMDPRQPGMYYTNYAPSHSGTLPSQVFTMPRNVTFAASPGNSTPQARIASLQELIQGILLNDRPSPHELSILNKAQAKLRELLAAQEAAGVEASRAAAQMQVPRQPLPQIVVPPPAPQLPSAQLPPAAAGNSAPAVQTPITNPPAAPAAQTFNMDEFLQTLQRQAQAQQEALQKAMLNQVEALGKMQSKLLRTMRDSIPSGQSNDAAQLSPMLQSFASSGGDLSSPENSVMPQAPGPLINPGARLFDALDLKTKRIKSLKPLMTPEAVRATDAAGNTALHRAILAKRHFAVISKLLEKGADKDARNGAGETPLYTATRVGLVSAVKVLLASGANTELPAPNGSKPIDVANGKVKKAFLNPQQAEVPGADDQVEGEEENDEEDEERTLDGSPHLQAQS